jgi:hypothetical protein
MGRVTRDIKIHRAELAWLGTWLWLIALVLAGAIFGLWKPLFSGLF